MLDLLEDIIHKWYERNEEDISYDTRLLYLIDLFQELKEAGLQKAELSKAGERLLFILDQDFIDESIHMVFQKRIAQEINYAYRRVIIEVDEVEDEPASAEVEVVRTVDDGDTYVNTVEPDIDLRGVDLGEITYDEDFIKDLGIK